MTGRVQNSHMALISCLKYLTMCSSLSVAMATNDYHAHYQIPQFDTNIQHYGNSKEYLDVATFIMELSQHLSTMLEILPDAYGQNTSVTATTDHFIVSSILKSNPSQCVNDTGRTIVGALSGQMWAVQMLDAAGKPGPSITQGSLSFMGSYKQCRSVNVAPDPRMFSSGFSGAYFVLQLGFGDKEMIGPQWGVCMPNTCSEQEVTAIFNQTLIMIISRIGGSDTLPFSVHLQPAQIRDNSRNVDSLAIVSIIIIAVIGLLVVLGTSYDVITSRQTSWLHSPSYQTVDTDTEKDTSEATTGQSHGELEWRVVDEKQTRMKILRAFSVYTNIGNLLDIQKSSENMTCLHGIRFFTINWVILLHTYLGVIPHASNIMEFIEMKQSWKYDWIFFNAFNNVDTFFVLSGLLTAHTTIKKMKRSGWKINWIRFYVHRYLRLTPHYFVVATLIMGLARFCGSGAGWSEIQPPDRPNCEQYWWRNLLYIQDLFRIEDLCGGHTWYLANDMKFFMISPLFIIPLFLKAKVGIAISTVVLMTSWITTGVLSATKNWTTSIIVSQMPSLTNVSVGSISDLTTVNDDDVMHTYYVWPWCRIGPYIVGVLAGYALATKKGNIKINRFVNLVGWVVALTTGLIIIFGLRRDVSGDSPNSVGVAALYNAVSRSAWGLCISWIIVSCVSGSGGVINRFLSWPAFEVLGRLTYMVYIIHFWVIFIVFSNMDQMYFVKDLNMCVIYLGIVCITYMLAFVANVAIERPFLALENILLP